MMLNGHGTALPSSTTWRQRDEKASDAGRASPRERPGARALALGAPLSAGFMGLLLMRDANAATDAADDAAGLAPPGREAVPEAGEAGPARGDGVVVPLATGIAISAGAGPAMAAALAVPGAVADAVPEPVAAASIGGMALEASSLQAETTPPSAPEIGDVVLAFGSVAPFEWPLLDDGLAGFEDENIGDIGDQRLIERVPVEDGETDAGEGGGVVGMRITGTPQNDLIHGTDGDDIIDAGDGKDTVFAGAGDDIVHGGPGNDVLHAGPGNDTIHGGEGNDTIYGNEGDSLLFGDEGNDIIHGGSGTDRIDGGPGIDRLHAGTGESTLVIDDWRDVAVGNPVGTSTLEVAEGFAASLRGRFSGAADGQATFVMGESPAGRVLPEASNAVKWQVDADIDAVHLTGTAAHDVVGSAKGDTIRGNDGNNRLYGGDGDDVLFAGGGDNELHGGAGDDVLHAGTGSDLLYGGDGDDILHAGSGESELHGGAGDDLYVFGLAEGGKGTVFDHEGVNRLRFEGLDDPGRIEARLDGDDLLLGHDGADIVRIGDYMSHRDAFAGIEHDGEVLTLDRFLAEPVAAEAGDLLALYLGPQSIEAEDDILDPTRLEGAGPEHDAPFALYEAAGRYVPADDGGAMTGGADDLLGAFMRAEPLWLGPEDGLFAPDAVETAGSASIDQQARG